eukprot:TRINITY_DN908_c0_g2_i1.p1 TRINITY_DN908_c0_g2~~TRINITY_DN908_c0_g2_i1.p1  ORF type:complete len:412 (+),score=43.48 TRINITY_DN908_c0_g2_i1:98-1333(+)
MVPDEEQPLLRDSRQLSINYDVGALKEKVRRSPQLNGKPYLDVENEPEYMLVMGISNAMFGVLVVLGAYWYVIASAERIMPHCKEFGPGNLPAFSLKKEQIKENMCYVSTFCFLTYPMICPMALIWMNWKLLLDKRVFYECLLNRIFLKHSAVSYFRSITFWFLLVYGALAVFCVRYMAASVRDGQGDDYLKYRVIIYGNLAYFSATSAFLFKLFTEWSVNSQILSLPNFAYESQAAAAKLLTECTYVQDTEFEVAWEKTETVLQRLAIVDDRAAAMSIAEILHMTLDMHRCGAEPKHLVASWLEAVYRFFATKRYWVARLLFCPQLQDWRTFRFRVCVRVYSCFMAVSVVFFCWGMFYTTTQYLLFQHANIAPELRKLPPPHHAPQVIEQARELIPKVLDRASHHSLKMP